MLFYPAETFTQDSVILFGASARFHFLICRICVFIFVVLRLQRPLHQTSGLLLNCGSLCVKVMRKVLEDPKAPWFSLQQQNEPFAPLPRQDSGFKLQDEPQNTHSKIIHTEQPLCK